MVVGMMVLEADHSVFTVVFPSSLHYLTWSRAKHLSLVKVITWLSVTRMA